MQIIQPVKAGVQTWAQEVWLQSLFFEIIRLGCFFNGNGIYTENTKGNNCKSRKKIYSDMSIF
jgi:hypothetical protein